MPSVENGGYYEGDAPQYVHLEKGEVIVPLDGQTLSEEDMIIVAGLQARIDELKDELESQGHSLDCLTTEYFLQQRKDDEYDQPTE
ncbi:hypothetical protein SEA_PAULODIABOLI_77 [Microbacterium phage PauloDiaboli]|nr:hypothetical protein SEA_PAULODIABOLI_77 [Microbacterium phage PauloDiaboli]QWY83927.1 hypothetical protein SEA_A3WALLY_77 [Microbacterium phage A3Wally]